MNGQWLKRVSFCALVVVLSACDSEGGIEGSGQRSSKDITSAGVVSALGSIVVNDVEYDLSGALVAINGDAATASDIAAGHVVIVEGELGASGTSATGKRVSVEIAIAGPIAAVDVELGRLTILGQTVALDEHTIIAEAIDALPLGGLDVGHDVEVSGFADSLGVLHATRIEARRIGRPLLVSGLVTELDASAGTFSVNGQRVDYTMATFTGLDAPAEGMRVRVASEGPVLGTFVASAVARRLSRLPGNRGDVAMVQGWITRLTSIGDFEVDNHPVVTTVSDDALVQLDAFVAVTGALTDNGTVEASQISSAVAPGRIVGSVVIDDVRYGISGVISHQGEFRLNIEGVSVGSADSKPGLGQLVGMITLSGQEAVGRGVLIGEGCGLPSRSRFCGVATPVTIPMTRTGRGINRGASGDIHATVGDTEETWPVEIGPLTGRPGFDPSFLGEGGGGGLWTIYQAEFAQNEAVVLSIDGDRRLYFQSAQTGCTGNGLIGPHADNAWNLYDISLSINGCSDPFNHLNAEFEGLATQESLTPWDYDFSVLSMWLSTDANASPPAAITLWAQYVF